MSVELKVKAKHLGEEAKIIRFEERKQKAKGNTELVNSLCNHRKWDVRNEVRATQLARAYIEGRSYKSVEQKRKASNETTFRAYVLPRVVKMINKYSRSKVNMEILGTWLDQQ